MGSGGYFLASAPVPHEFNRKDDIVRKIIIGADLIKDIPTLISAYDDKKGITAKFNKNILQRTFKVMQKYNTY